MKTIITSINNVDGDIQEFLDNKDKFGVVLVKDIREVDVINTDLHPDEITRLLGTLTQMLNQTEKYRILNKAIESKILATLEKIK